jgi:hypothetical protein
VKHGARPLEIGFQQRYLSDITNQILLRVEIRVASGSEPTALLETAPPKRYK